ncbi:unnamed protein product [Pieris macdunnoughi]|uniref:C2H2-type domain-containing protein n=1 Tax=Pieris macdunnoughi TaxID=345717 RepID=A0A821VE37_9NEOP|nr:unnamed protein product [Pieris macdunnoughi]
MTMDIQNNYQSYKEQSPNSKESNLNIESARTSQVKADMQSTVINPGKTSKRSFDVAFLMMPDEKPRQLPPEKQLRVSKQIFKTEEWEQSSQRLSEMYKHSDYSNDNTLDSKDDDDRARINNNMSPGFGSDGNIDVGTDEFPSKTTYGSDSESSDKSRSRPNSNDSAARPPKFLPEYKNKIFDDPTLISVQTRARYENRFFAKQPEVSPKSAFTKVSNFGLRSPIPNPSVSPDNLLYQNSISPPLATSPPVNSFNKSGFNNLLTPAHLLNGQNFFKAHNIQLTSPSYSESAHVQRSTVPIKTIDYQAKSNTKVPVSPNKMNFLPFRPELPYLPGGSSYPFGVQNFQQSNADFMKFQTPQREPVNPLIANPAAAILSTLLPSTLAAFSLPAQNVCAKCNISFRMTSDLVYHMRTHHKSESAVDPNRRKREEKLKCPVCNESFRERHHLTRHMTAHQDKEGDMEDVLPSQSFNKKSKQFFSNVQK